jgi:hypothetical protein
VVGCTLVFDQIGQLAQSAAFGIAAMCGHGGPTPPLGQRLVPLREVKSAITIASPSADFPVAAIVPHARKTNIYGATATSPLRDRLPTADIEPSSIEDIRLFGGYIFFDTDSEQLEQSAANTLLDKGTADLLSPMEHFQADANSANAYGRPSPPTAIMSAGTASNPTVSGTADQDEFQEAIPDDNMDAGNAKLSRGGFQLNAGYSSIEGIGVGAKISKTNILGLDTEIRASAHYSKVRTSFELGYTDNDFLNDKFAFAPTLFADKVSAKNFGTGHQLSSFRQSTRGLNVLINRKFGPGLAATANYRLSSDTFYTTNKSTPCDSAILGSAICDAVGKRTSSILSAAMTLDRRHQKSNMALGYRLRLSQDLSVGGSTSFSRTRLGGEAQLGLGDGINLSVDVEGGYLAPIGKKPIPLFERFFIGQSSMRGFDLRGIGPKILPTGAAPGRNVGIGGQAYYTARTELSVAAGGILGVQGVKLGVFVDAGSVFSASRAGLLPGETLSGNSAKPRIAVGAGLSFDTPMGKLRIDFAKPVAKQPGDRSKMLSISFGAAI